MKNKTVEYDKLTKFYERVFFYQQKLLRNGQCYVNALSDVDPEFSKTFIDTEEDPFYNDKAIPFFLKKVYEEWNIP
jgi:hypothetical protein